MKKALPLVLLGGAVLLFCIGVAALAFNFLGNRGEQANLTQWKAPLEQVDARQLRLANALEPLAGMTDIQAIDDALQQGDWESAYAVVAYSPDLSDAIRAGTLLLLGSRYQAAKQPVRAAWAYQYAADIVQLSPIPSDLVRVQTLLEAGQGQQGLGQKAAARAALDQAYLILEYSATIARDSRARLLADAAKLYKEMGVANLAQQAQQKSADVSAAAAEEANAPAHAPYRQLPGELPANAELKDKIAERTTAAKELIDQLNLHPPKAGEQMPEELLRTLGDRLFEEDGLRQDYFAEQFSPTADSAVQNALLRDRIRWLGLKLRVARGGFGVSLVPEWETEKDQIAADLSDAFDELYKLNEQEAVAVEDPAEADHRLEDVLRAEVVSGRLGLYAYDEGDLRARLADLSTRLRDNQVPGLRLDSYTRGNQTVYLLVPDDLYGQGDKALPR